MVLRLILPRTFFYKIKLYKSSFFPFLKLRLPATVPGMEPALLAAMDTYAQQVKEPGTYLEIIDAELFAKMANKTLTAIWHEPGELEVKHSSDFWTVLLPEGIQYVQPPGSINRSRAWCVISCSANYDELEPVRNHSVPGFFKEAIQADEWYSLTVVARASASEKLHALIDQHELLNKAEAPTDAIFRAEHESRLLDVELKIAQFLVRARFYSG